MKKIILAVILSSLIPALAVAEDKKMQNTHASAPDNMKGKHMMNTHTSASDIDMKDNKHMSMGDNPFSSHNKKVGTKTNQPHKGYTIKKFNK